MAKAQNHSETIVFSYRGMNYSGHVISSTDLEPHFLWFIFDDQEIIDILTDSVAFREEDGQLTPVQIYSRNAELVRQVQQATEAWLQSQKGDSVK